MCNVDDAVPAQELAELLLKLSDCRGQWLSRLNASMQLLAEVLGAALVW